MKHYETPVQIFELLGDEYSTWTVLTVIGEEHYYSAVKRNAMPEYVAYIKAEGYKHVQFFKATLQES